MKTIYLFISFKLLNNHSVNHAERITNSQLGKGIRINSQQIFVLFSSRGPTKHSEKKD
jgi:uncharacterized protein (UPF0212 family)